MHGKSRHDSWRSASTLTGMLISQADFHQQCQHLHNPHVRALAWMLTAPGLLDAQAPVWQDALVLVPSRDHAELLIWLSELDRHPEDLLALLHRHPSRRLGLYAERLFEFYLHAHGMLYAHGLQVHNKGKNTVGEFDFLLHDGDRLFHLELATKFYLYHPAVPGGPSGDEADLYSYLGPNLADSLGAKIKKIIGQQLQLSQHPLAQHALPQAVDKAQALVLGWLFYRDADRHEPQLLASEKNAGIHASHYRGAIWTQAEVQALDFEQALLLDRLDWLAPVQTALGMTQDKQAVMLAMQQQLAASATPLMLALMQESQGLMQEYSRGMVVPDDWFEQADEVIKKSSS